VKVVLTVREEHRLRRFENKVLSRIFGSKRAEIIRGCRKFHYKEFCNSYCPPDIIKMIESRSMTWAGHVARMRAKRNAYTVLMGKPEGNIQLRRPRHRWEVNIKMIVEK
jgi:hypothetical protein